MYPDTVPADTNISVNVTLELDSNDPRSASFA